MTMKPTLGGGRLSRTSASLASAALTVACATTLFGCAEAAFSVHTQDNDLATLKPTVERIKKTQVSRAPRSGTGHATVFVSVGPERRFGQTEPSKSVEQALIGYDLTSGKELFSVPAEVRSRFVVSQGVVMYREGAGELLLRDAQNGSVRARVALEPGETLAGLASDDSQLYYVTRAKIGGENKSFLTALLPNGTRVWRLPGQGSMGAPAAWGGLVAVPYRYQDVVVLDSKSGQELTRIRQKDEQIGFVREGKSGFLYGVGASGAALLDEKSQLGERKTISYLSPQLGERVRVFMHWDGYRAEQTDFSAFDRNRLLWDAEAQGDSLRFSDDQTVLHSYRFLFGMNAKDGTVRWAFANPRQTLMASDLVDQLVLYVAQDGEIGGLTSQAGAKVISQRLSLKPGQQVLGASFDAAGLAVPTTELGKAEPVLSVLRGIIFDRDSSFLSVKSFAVQALGAVPGKEAAAELLRVITAEGMPTEIARTAGEVLSRRKDDPKEVSTLLLAALKQSYDYLEDKRPRGLDVLARVATAVSATETVPLLAERLLDPNTPAAALKDVVRALTKLGGKDEIAPLRQSLLLYRADPLFASDPEVLKRAGEGLLAVGGEPERRLVQFVSMEPHTLPGLATHFRKVLDDRAAPRPAAKSSAKPAQVR